jgi:hypothetical protein
MERFAGGVDARTEYSTASNDVSGVHRNRTHNNHDQKMLVSKEPRGYGNEQYLVTPFNNGRAVGLSLADDGSHRVNCGLPQGFKGG